MTKYLIALFAIFFCIDVYAQQWHSVAYNLGMEKFKADSTWTEPYYKGYTFKIDTAVKHSGRQSILMMHTDTGGKFSQFLFTRQNKFEGKELEIRAWLKLENVTGLAMIAVREYDVDGNSFQFASNQSDKLHGTKDWKLYSIKVPLDSKAQFFSFGSILTGGGKVWLDDEQLLIDGKDISQATINPNFNPNPPHHPKYGNNASAGGWVKLKNATLYYETYGSGEPLFLQHGDSQSIKAFMFQIPELSKHFKVIAPRTRQKHRRNYRPAELRTICERHESIT